MGEANDFVWDFYVLNSHAKLVMGFNDEAYAKRYAQANRYRMYTKGTIKKKKIDVFKPENWTDRYSKKGLDD